MFYKIFKYIRKNYLLILTLLLIIILLFFSFRTFHKEYYSFEKYDELKSVCQSQKDESSCALFNDMETLKKQYESLDVKTYYFEILYHYMANYLVIIAPLLVILQTINFLHREFSSGFIRNYFTRMSYKKYKRKLYLTSLKSAIILPAIILIIFIISAIITKFNFNTPTWVYDISMYDKNNYNNFFSYFVSALLAVYLLGIMYSNICVSFLNKSKNSLLVTIFSYLTFFICVILVDVGGSIILIRLCKFNSNISTYLNIFDYWHIKGSSNHLSFVVVAAILALISHFIVRLIYKEKEGIIIQNEKEVV